ncbi:TetR/AcrR family transcriptional regulator [Pseudoclavibacter sp. AY1F1]|uniref:TetR/AcrR family transcriptional regulator n=1 Tax=Pseudoclavibacter sp. AY1F1 TaxID=2080583 RepID=UPI000CE90076|nr:TetR/AcrR family transcriptional regulator [Pseudoclavibacter sp. AY1F1]PPF43081.1 TetR/AcrR family transcriptional regulator [Pseudoclavibacter sp. AY1F1]
MSIRTTSATKLLDAAEELFFTQGIHATPVDAVIERAGVSAATMYRGYASKEALLAATLDRRQTEWLNTWDTAVSRATTREGRILAIFDALDAFREHPVRAQWCAFLGSAAEYPHAPAEVRAAVDADTAALRERLTAAIANTAAGRGTGIGTEANVDDTPGAASRDRELADQLLLIVSGDLAMRLRDAAHTTASARRIAATLIHEHTAYTEADEVDG